MILFGIAVAGLALVAMLVRTVMARQEVSGRYRSAVAASAGLLTVAALSYAVIFFQFLTGYRLDAGGWTPGLNARLA